MNRTTMRRLFGALTMTAVLAGCGAPAPTTPAPSATSTAPGTSAATAYLLETAEFSVGFPQEPVTGSQDIPGDPPLTAETYSVGSDASAVSVALIDYPADAPLADPDTALQGARDGAVGGLPGGTLVSSETTTVDGRPALDFVADVDGGTYHARLVLDDRRLYQILTVGSGDLGAQHAEFVDTFRLTS